MSLWTKLRKAVIDPVVDEAQRAVDNVGNAVGKVGTFITEHPLEAAALAVGGYYFAPEIGAWLGPAGETVAGTEAGVAAGTAVPEALATGTSGTTAAMAGGFGDGAASGAAGTAAAGAGTAAAGAGMAQYLTPAALLLSGVAGANASKSAAQVQTDAANRAAELQNQQYQQTRTDYAPWRAAGEQALNKLIPLSDYTKFGMDQFQQDPGYAFRLSEGQKALDRSAAARGGLISGAALKAATRFGQDMGSQEYQNAFNRYQTERNAQLNPLQSLAGLGQTALGQTTAAGQNYATNAGNALTSGAQATASGYMGSTNAMSNSLSQYLQYQNNNNLLDVLQKNRSTYN